MNAKDEISCQHKALQELSHGDGKIAGKVIINSQIPVIFRKIINDFEIEQKRVPTTDELIWITSEMLNFNIRELFEGEK